MRLKKKRWKVIRYGRSVTNPKLIRDDHMLAFVSIYERWYEETVMTDRDDILIKL
jgi:hypothetical protein